MGRRTNNLHYGIKYSCMPAVAPPSEPTFYMTCEKRNRIKEIIETEKVPVMQNVMLYHNGESFREFNCYDTRYVVDSGGYSAMNEYGGDFPWSVREYHNWLQQTHKRAPFDWAAIMDLACEPAFDGDMTVKERQDRTLENTIAHFELEPEYPLLPVLQGRTVQQWLEYHDRLKDHGIPTEYVGVGTLCRQSSTKQIAKIESQLRAGTNIKAMHGFGVKISSFNHGARFESADSQAWSWPTKFGNKYTLTGENPPQIQSVDYQDSKAAHRESFEAYWKRAKYLHANSQPPDNHKQGTLREYA